MSNNKVIYSYSQGSEGAKELAKALGIKRLRHDGNSKWQGGKDKVLINWGSSQLPEQFTFGGTKIINHPNDIGNMSNKLLAFRLFSGHGVSVPPWTEGLKEAQRWLNDGKTVFARTILQGHSGNGIVIMEPDHPDTHDTRAQLYTMYIPKDSEYRVHVCNGQVILVQRKGLSKEFQGQKDVNWKIRNLANGFIFAREGIDPPQAVLDQAVGALRASKLHFGAVDVIYNSKRKEAYVLEVNCAPGLVGSTIEDYSKALGAL